MEITNNQEVDDNQLHNYLLPVTHVLTNFTHSEAMWALMNGKAWRNEMTVKKGISEFQKPPLSKRG